ncbi:hypothetical protein [Thermoactinomyces mirandus]|uniref:Uncharacterized protein n=1 Tax=Thermoactinomyces mirandus TaxID=2756294 RepID=A0A7W1XS65_9BACL|nr:hypothetical protein [Thermoactinomyces mirandus]MBA4602160.1 hypothetical protein [Thermoactinomyces mirandus]
MMRDHTKRKNFDRLVDQIEQEILNAIRECGPQPYYTEMYLHCSICYKKKKRTELRITKDPEQIYDEFAVCLHCIDKLNLTVSKSERALDFKARTYAIMRIISGVLPFDESEEKPLTGSE